MTVMLMSWPFGIAAGQVGHGWLVRTRAGLALCWPPAPSSTGAASVCPSDRPRMDIEKRDRLKDQLRLLTH